MFELQYQIHQNTLDIWIAKNLQLRHIVDLVVFDEDMFGFHLWYFYAMLYDLIIFYIADKWGVLPF